MNTSLISTVGAALVLTFTPLASQAQTALGDHLTISGFGTLGAVSTDDDRADYRSDLRQHRGATESVDFGVDSKLGVQANLKLSDTFSAVAQVLASRRTDDRPVVEWLYGQAALPAGATVKLGRMVLPTFMVSDSRSVGYAQHWLRAPQTVYTQYPASSFDGAQLQYRRGLGAFNLTAQVSFGQAKADLATRNLIAKVDLPRVKSLNVLLESGNWLARFGHTASPDTTIKGLPFPKFDDKFTGYGLQYDNGTALVMAEYARRRQSGLGVLDSNSWYVSGGWHFGAWMPYLTVGQMTPKGVAYGTTDSDRLRAIGLRWDAAQNIAVKAQVEKMTSGVSSFVQATPAFYAQRPAVRVISASVDFVF